MQQLLKIWHLEHRHINRDHWNQCLQQHFPGHLYMQSWFLDVMVPGWEALVQADSANGPYHSIMALPAKKKWFISYLYQPFLTAQLGYVGPDPSPSTLSQFLKAIPGKFRYWDFCLNETNPALVNGFRLHTRRNFVLPLQNSHDQITSAYLENTTRNIRKAEQNGCDLKQLSYQDALQFYISYAYQKPTPQETEKLKHLLNIMSGKDRLTALGMQSGQNQLLSVCLFFWQDQRVYYLMPANHPGSRGTGSSHALIDAFIRANSGRPVILDFEGSDVDSVARFYRGFGAIERNYPSIFLNRLPWPIRWMKK